MCSSDLDATISIEDSSVGSVGGYGIGGYWSGHAPDVYVSNVDIGATSSAALYFDGRESTGDGTVELADVTVESSSGDGLYASGIGEIQVSNVDLGAVSGDGVEVLARTYWYYYDSTSGSYIYSDLDAATDFSAEGLSIESTSGYGLSFKGGTASISDLTVGTSGYGGLYAAGLDSLTLDGATFTSPTGDGISSTDGYSYYSYDSSATTATVSVPDVSLTDVTVATSTGSAFSFSGGSVTLSGVSGTGSTENGVDLDGVTATVVGNTFTGNTGYGMSCTEDVVLSSCSGNDLTNNTAGTHLGCADSCGE